MPSRAKKSLTIIDDDSELRDEITRFFANAYAVTAILGDLGALKLLREAPPSGIILDLDLTTFDAFELLRLSSGSAQLRGIPIVVLSSSNESATLEKAHRFGASEFVTKPFSPEELGHRLENLISGRTQRTAGRLKLGTLLVASGLVNQTQLDGALEYQRSNGGRLGDVLVEEGIVSEQEIVTAVAGQMRIGVVDLSQSAPDTSVIGLLPRDFIIRRRLMPLRVDGKGSLVLAMTNPLDVISIDEVGMRTKKRVVPVICTDKGFDEAVSIYFSSRGKLKDAREENGDAAVEPGAGGIDATIIEIVNGLLADAASMDASDIHLEPREDMLNVRCRIDGVLHDLREFPKGLQAGILSRLKIMGNLNIAERRLPQDGRTTFELSSGKAVDLRLASIPSLYGENITIRILEVTPLPPTLASLGLDGVNLERFELALRAPEGGIVVVGPTGSGKSTTLYTTLELIKTPERKVYTVEDPVERKITGIVQTEVNPAIGLTFSQSLRSLVRADPDVIMVGEIRDVETAKMAADAAVTGHQVFSTLHTNDSSSAVNRLIEMGVPRYLVAAAWRCFVAQRLVRRLCPHCRATETLSEARWQELGLGPAPRKRMKVYNPAGCAKCFGTGYRGRIGLYEVLVVDDQLRDLIATGGTVLEIQRLARSKGVESLRDDGVRKVLEGSTSYLELLRVTV